MLRIAVLLFALLMQPATAEINFLTADDGTYLTDQYGGRLVLAGDVHTLMNLNVWNGLPGPPVISLIADVEKDLSGITVRGFAAQGQDPIKSTTLYLNNRLVATCPGAVCASFIPKASMLAGLNEILVVFIDAPCAQANSDAFCARGTSSKISRP